MPHAFGFPAMTKSHFGKNLSYEILTSDRQFIINPIALRKAKTPEDFWPF